MLNSMVFEAVSPDKFLNGKLSESWRNVNVPGGRELRPFFPQLAFNFVPASFDRKKYTLWPDLIGGSFESP